MVDVYLHGVLAKKFGEKFKLKVSSIQEAVRAIEANRKNFRRFLQQNKDLYLKIIVNEEPIKTRSEINRTLDSEQKEIHFVPVPIGAIGKDLFGAIQVAVGALLVVVGVALLFVPGGQAFGVAAIVGGLGLFASGIITLLTPTPKFDERRRETGGRSAIFENAPVTTIQGDPIPIGYGELEVSPFTIFSKITTFDDSSQSAEEFINCQGGDGGKK